MDRYITSTAVDKSTGYVYFMDKQHPLADSKGRVLYHRHVLSCELGRWVTSDEVVHHIDDDKTNNAPSNLRVMSRGAHRRFHNCGVEDPLPARICATCGAEFYRSTGKYCCCACAQIMQRVTERPSKAQLLSDLEHMTYVAVGRKYGVSDNAIRKWLRHYEG